MVWVGITLRYGSVEKQTKQTESIDWQRASLTVNLRGVANAMSLTYFGLKFSSNHVWIQGETKHKMPLFRLAWLANRRFFKYGADCVNTEQGISFRSNAVANVPLIGRRWPSFESMTSQFEPTIIKNMAFMWQWLRSERWVTVQEWRGYTTSLQN